MRCGRPPSHARIGLTYFEFQLKVYFYLGWHREELGQAVFTRDMRVGQD